LSGKKGSSGKRRGGTESVAIARTKKLKGEALG